MLRCAVRGAAKRCRGSLAVSAALYRMACAARAAVCAPTYSCIVSRRTHVVKSKIDMFYPTQRGTPITIGVRTAQI